MFVALLICSFNAALRSAQEGLRRSEINFRSLVTNAPYGICRCDSGGILLSANPALVEHARLCFGLRTGGRNLANLYADTATMVRGRRSFSLLAPLQGLIAIGFVRTPLLSLCAFPDEPFVTNTTPRSSNCLPRM